MRRQNWAILILLIVLVMAGTAAVAVMHKRKTASAERPVPGVESPGTEDAGETEETAETERAEEESSGAAGKPGASGDRDESAGGEDRTAGGEEETAGGKAGTPEEEAEAAGGKTGTSGDENETAGGKAGATTDGKTGTAGVVPGTIDGAGDDQEKQPPTIVWMSDIHYLTPALTDYGPSFQAAVEADDGKLTGYTPQLLEAFIDEVIELHPDALVLGGDVTFNGEKQSHIDLSERLRRVQDAGVQVLMMPGNHDLSNHNAVSFSGDTRTHVESVNGQEFYEIYHDYGFDQAVSRDPASLSYIYELDEENWLLLLDSCQYEDGNKVDGRIREATYEWMTGIVTEAVERGITVIPMAHHNLMDESRLFTTECTMADNERLIALLESWRCPVFMSGHLHLQRMLKHETGEDYGIYEIVGGSFSIPPCKYGILEWKEDGTLDYRTKELDMAAWVARNAVTDENLLNFSQYAYNFLLNSVGAKMASRDLEYLPKGQEQAMKDLYVKVYESYCQGVYVDMTQMEQAQNYWMWERNRPDSDSRRKLDIMINDAYSDNRQIVIPIYKKSAQ